MVELAKPILTFDMLQVGRRSGVLAARAFKDFFGSDNYALFRRAGKTREYVPEEDRQRVDLEVYDKVRKMVGDSRRSGEGIWKQVIELSNSTLNYARLRLFADQERQASLITKVDVSRRPSSALEILTTPTEFIGEQCKYDQGRQLALALVSAEIISADTEVDYGRILEEIDRNLEEQFFTDKRRGDPKPYRIFSYHIPGTNRLTGLSDQYPDPQFAQGLWVKKLDYGVRTIGLRSTDGTWPSVQALYEPRKKEVESGVIKAVQRSLKATRDIPNGIIETSPYSSDRLGLSLTVMGGRPLRDMVTARLEDFLQAFGDGIDEALVDDLVMSENGVPNRVQFRRRQFHIRGLKRPLEVKIQALGDYISSEYEVGDFDPDLGMHNGSAHDLYKLRIVADVAEYLWPFEIYGIYLKDAKKFASYEYATRLGRKQREYPSPYEDSVALV